MTDSQALVKTLDFQLHIQSDNESLLSDATLEARSVYNETIRLANQGVDWDAIPDRVADDATLVKNTTQRVVAKALGAMETYGKPRGVTLRRFTYHVSGTRTAFVGAAGGAGTRGLGLEGVATLARDDHAVPRMRDRLADVGVDVDATVATGTDESAVADVVVPASDVTAPGRSRFATSPTVRSSRGSPPRPRRPVTSRWTSSSRRRGCSAGSAVAATGSPPNRYSTGTSISAMPSPIADSKVSRSSAGDDGR